MKEYEQNEFIEKFNNYLYIILYFERANNQKIFENSTDSLRKIFVKERKILKK